MTIQLCCVVHKEVNTYENTIVNFYMIYQFYMLSTLQLPGLLIYLYLVKFKQSLIPILCFL